MECAHEMDVLDRAPVFAGNEYCVGIGVTPNGKCRKMESISIKALCGSEHLYILGKFGTEFQLCCLGLSLFSIAVFHDNLLKNFRVSCFRRVASISSSQFSQQCKFFWGKNLWTDLSTCFLFLDKLLASIFFVPKLYWVVRDSVLHIASKLYGQTTPPLRHGSPPFWSG